VDGYRRPAIDAGDRIELLLTVDHVRDLAQIDRAAALLRNDDATKLRRVLDLAFHPHHRIVVSARDPAGGHVLVGVLYGRHDLIDANAERRKRGGSAPDKDLPPHAPVDVA